MAALVRFEDEEALRPALVGHKFVALARAFRAGFAVPPAVAIRTDAHRYYLQTQSWPDGLLPAVLAAANELGLTVTGLSVRSSATLEDLATHSFAGQYRSFLKIGDVDELIEKVEQCWQSTRNSAVQSYLASARGLSEREAGSDEAANPAMGVILQRMVSARAAGVAFGRDPMRPSRRTVVIEAVDGLAEALVSGSATPYRAEVDLDGTVRIQAMPQEQLPAPGGLLSNADWCSIAAMVRSLESLHSHEPLDIEWAIDTDDKLWLLQARRITFLHGSADVPEGAWTRKIADDLWADRLTPFMADVMLENAPHYDLSTVSKRLGLYPGRENLAVINGYLYVSCDSLLHVVSFIPPKFRLTGLKALFPPTYDLGKIPPPSLGTLLRIGIRMVQLAVTEPASVPLICLRQSKHFQAKMHRRFDRLERSPAADAKQAFERAELALEMMVLTQIHNQFPYTYATLFTWVLRWLVVDIQKRPHADFLSLIATGGRNITITVEREIRRMAAQIKRDPMLRAKFAAASPKDLWGDLPRPLRDELEAFLKKYGCRSRHRTLLLKRWAEAPEEVLAMLKALVAGTREGTDVGDVAELSFTGASPAPAFDMKSASLAARLAQPLIRPTRWLARSFLDLREDLRFLLDKALYQIRLSLLEVGRLLRLGDGILFLTRHEIKELMEQKWSIEEARTLSDRRCKQFLVPYAPSPFFVDRLPLEESGDDQDTIRGLGTSPGRAVGRARIVDDPFKIAIEDGDILVARHTDPGWTPILSRVGGMVMEEGGLLNHCSIVARELGVPAVVGISHATRRIPEGARLMVDGGLGVIRIEAPPEDGRLSGDK